MVDTLSKKEAMFRENLLSKGFTSIDKTLKNLRLIGDSPLGSEIKSIVALAVKTPFPDGALNNLEKLATAISYKTLEHLIEGEGIKIILYLCGSSNSLPLYLLRSPGYIEELFIDGDFFKKKNQADFTRELAASIVDTDSLDGAARGLRLYRQREYVRIGGRNLTGYSSMQEATKELSCLAEAALEVAYRVCSKALKSDYGIPYYTDGSGIKMEAEFVTIGMGKLGGGELNFSSDIDLIYIYSSDKGETSGITGRSDTSISLQHFFTKMAKMITKMLSAVTEDGLVFRVDLDLRPEGRSGDIVNSLRSAEVYYESWGQTWERTAMIKARPVAGDCHLGEEFLRMITPFVYRRHLDFTAIDEIKAMKERIDLNVLRIPRKALDVKLGIGGIREIEFFVQALQLIYGGREKGIREKNTMAALDKLLNKGYLGKEDVACLKDAYIFLRDVEHRLQIVEERQIHKIPKEGLELNRIARMMKCEGKGGGNHVDTFLDDLRRHTESVHEIYNSLFYAPSKELEEGISPDVLVLFSPDISNKDGIERLSKMGFQDPAGSWKMLLSLKNGPPFIRMPSKARLLLNKIVPFIFSRILTSPDIEMSLKHMETFTATIGSKTVFYSLLAENKRIIELLVRLFGMSIFLSRSLIEHPDAIEMLLSREFNKPIKSKDKLYIELDNLLETTDCYEDQLDAMRHFRNNEVLRIGSNDIFGYIEPLTASKQLSFLADISLRKAYEIAYEELSKKYGRPNCGRFALFGLGKLGGEEILYASDLDIIFVYSGSGETEGPKVLSSQEFYTRLGQKIISILSLMTRAGLVFKIDTRLRPSGSAGPLAVTEEAFILYHREQAVAWEKQAMIKARFVCGDYTFGMAILQGLREAIYQTSLTKTAIEDIYRIRQRMETEIAKESPTKYNIKTGKGGIVDIEFLTQILQLIYGHEDPSVRAQGTLTALKALSEKGYVSTKDYTILKEAYGFYRLVENRLRIAQDRPEGDLIKGSKALFNLARRLGYEGPAADKSLLRDYLKRAKKVRRLYLKVAKEGIQ